VKKMLAYAVLVVLVIATLAGAQTAPPSGAVLPLPADDQREIEKYLGAGVVGAPVKAEPLGTIADYLGSSDKVQFTFQSLQGADAGTTGVGWFTWLQRQDDSRGWQYDAGGNTVLFGRATKSGNLEVLSSQDRQQGVISRYSPPEPMLVPGLKPGETRRAKIAVAVFDLAKPDRQTHSGSLDLAHTYVGAYVVTVPAGKFEAALLKWIYKGKVGPADVSDVQYRFLAKGGGVVAMIEKIDISAFLLYQDKSRIARVLVKRD